MWEFCLFTSAQTKILSTAEENQQNQASLHPALDVFTKIFAGIMQQQQQPGGIAPTTGIVLELFKNPLIKQKEREKP